MENKEFYRIFPELGYGVFEEKIEKPWSLICKLIVLLV
jgi:hypothetical protein